MTTMKRKETKFVGAYVPEETHAALGALATREHRTMSDQIRLILDRVLAGELVVPRAEGLPKNSVL